MQEKQAQFLSQEEPLEKDLGAHPSPDHRLPLPPDEGCGSTGLGSLEEGQLSELLKLSLEQEQEFQAQKNDWA